MQDTNARLEPRHLPHHSNVTPENIQVLQLLLAQPAKLGGCAQLQTRSPSPAPKTPTPTLVLFPAKRAQTALSVEPMVK